MSIPRQIRQNNLPGKPRQRRPLPNLPPPVPIPREIAPGIFFVNPSGGGGGGGSKDKKDAPPPLLWNQMLANLKITHAIVARGTASSSCAGLKALFVGPYDPLSKIVAWMRAVRRLGARIIVSDIAVVAGSSTTHRLAAGGSSIPPIGDPLLDRLHALARAQTEKRKENEPEHISECIPGGEFARYKARDKTQAESRLKHVSVSV
ncbi:hypothetical protein BGW80DRAFT_1247203 [Lactifluus volemus]|nr:hypothetical protein BGW80DRAFT_1247203 [Lactifluus volemus]